MDGWMDSVSLAVKREKEREIQKENWRVKRGSSHDERALNKRWTAEGTNRRNRSICQGVTSRPHASLLTLFYIATSHYRPISTFPLMFFPSILLIQLFQSTISFLQHLIPTTHVPYSSSSHRLSRFFYNKMSKSDSICFRMAVQRKIALKKVICPVCANYFGEVMREKAHNIRKADVLASM